jgi:enoyl-CoA hydratase
MVLFGQRLDGARAADVGLAWACYPDGELVDRAVELASNAASVPRELSAAAAATLREVPWQADFDAAVATEVTRQTWSLGQGWFKAR